MSMTSVKGVGTFTILEWRYLTRSGQHEYVMTILSVQTVFCKLKPAVLLTAWRKTSSECWNMCVCVFARANVYTLTHAHNINTYTELLLNFTNLLQTAATATNWAKGTCLLNNWTFLKWFQCRSRLASESQSASGLHRIRRTCSRAAYQLSSQRQVFWKVEIKRVGSNSALAHKKRPQLHLVCLHINSRCSAEAVQQLLFFIVCEFNYWPATKH